MWCDGMETGVTGTRRLSPRWPHPGTWRGYYLYFVTLSGEVWGRGGGGAGLPVSRGSAQHPTPSSAVLMKTRRGAPASRAHWRHGHTFSWRHMWGPDIRWWSLYLCLHRLLSLKWWSVSPSGHTPHMLSYAEQPRYAPHLALIAPRRAHQPIALLCVIRKRKLSFAAHFPHLPAAAARLVT